MKCVFKSVMLVSTILASRGSFAEEVTVPVGTTFEGTVVAAKGGPTGGGCSISFTSQPGRESPYRGVVNDNGVEAVVDIEENNNSCSSLSGFANINRGLVGRLQATLDPGCRRVVSFQWYISYGINNVGYSIDCQIGSAGAQGMESPKI